MKPGAEADGRTPHHNDAYALQMLVECLDAEVRAAIHDVDRTLIRLALAQRPRDRLRSSSNMMSTLMRLRRARSSSRR